MNKLHKLKKYLTIADTAKVLTVSLGEDVTEADVLQLAIDNHLVISVLFNSMASAWPGTIRLRDSVPAVAVNRKGFHFKEWVMGMRVSLGHVVSFDDRQVSLSGLFDLPMVAGGKLFIERRHAELMGWSPISVINPEGIIVKSEESVFVLQRTDSEVTDRQEIIEKQVMPHHPEKYLPCDDLPLGSVLAVRTEELFKFEQTLSGNSPDAEKPLNTVERNMLLTIIAVLCKQAKLDYSKAAKTALSIQSTAAEMRISISESGIENHLEKIPTALVSRSR